MNYWLHRISHECEASYALKDKGYLSIGWNLLDVSALAAAREDDAVLFNGIMDTKRKSKWYLWYFAHIKKGDIIVVPEFGGAFSVYEATDIAYEAKYYENEIEGTRLKWNSDSKITWINDAMYYAPSIREDNKIDIGFLIKVKPVLESISRYDYADDKLTSRMKFRGTTADINDIAASVDRAVSSAQENRPLNFYETAATAMSDILNHKIQNELNPDKFEKLVKWYLDRIGADKVYILPKNNPEIEGNADADVIAEFEKLKYIVYVQAKHHTAVSGDWAVKQVSQYAEQKCDNDEYNYASWVISSGEFSDEAVELAALSGVRLIDGKTFARMLIDEGIANINEAF